MKCYFCGTELTTDSKVFNYFCHKCQEHENIKYVVTTADQENQEPIYAHIYVICFKKSLHLRFYLKENYTVLVKEYEDLGQDEKPIMSWYSLPNITPANAPQKISILLPFV